MENDKTLHNDKKQTNKAKIIKIEVLELLKSLLKDLTNDKLKSDKELAMCLSVANNTNSKVLPMYLIMDIKRTKMCSHNLVYYFVFLESFFQCFLIIIAVRKG